MFLTTLFLTVFVGSWLLLFKFDECGFLTVLLLGQIYYCNDFLLVMIFYVFLEILLDYGLRYWLKKLKLLIWYKSFYKNYSFIVFGILALFLLLLTDDFLVLIVLTVLGVGLGVTEDNLYFLALSLAGDFPGDTGFDRCVIDDLYLMGMSILKLKI